MVMDMIMPYIMNTTVWIMTAIFTGVLSICALIFFYFLFKKSHAMVELKCWFSKTPIALFFQDNRFCEMKPIAAVNGVVYDKNYGPFIVTTTYVDKRTKNILMPFDVDMDGDRTTNMKEIVDDMRNITNNEKSIIDLRTKISENKIKTTKNIDNLTSFMLISSMKKLFNNSTPHNIKSKIEKIVSERVEKYANVDPIQAIIVFGAIFGIIVIGSILIKTIG